jgi:hypothetical protein
MKIKSLRLYLSLALLFSVLIFTLGANPQKAEAIAPIVFPVVGPAHYSNDYYVPRPNGVHGATDIMAGKGQQLIAAVDGTITYVAWPQASFGYDVEITDNQGYTYVYLHINDDNPGTNDGNGGGMHAYAPDMQVGNKVVKGQHLGYVGDSGRANGIPHLHFEIIAPDGGHLNPYDSLNSAARYGEPSWYPELSHEALPYNVFFKGIANMAMGNFDADPADETVVTPGAPGAPHVRFLDNNHIFFANKGFYAYAPSFTGGVDVAAGDVDGDGIDEVITGAGPGASPHVRIMRVNGTEVGGFYAYAQSFPGGVRVAAGDVDGDGKDEIITAAGAGGGPHVRIFKPNGTEVGGFYAYAANFTGGLDVTAGDTEGTSIDEIITGAGAGGSSHVRVFNPSGVDLKNFAAYYPVYKGGVKVSAGNVRTGTPKDEIMTSPWVRGGSHIRLLNGDGTVITEKLFLEAWWEGYYDIAAGNGDSKASSGVNRRATVRAGLK